MFLRKKGLSMFELLVCILFFWLLVKTVGLTFRITWGMAKLVAGLLMVLALPVLILVLLFVGGFFLMIPLIMVALAAGIVKACVKA